MQFYLEYFQKGADGKYHIYPANVHENCWGAKDGVMDLAAVRGVMPRLIEASQILNTDAAMRSKWQEFLDNLASYPMGEDPEAKKLGECPEGTYAYGLLGDRPGCITFLMSGHQWSGRSRKRREHVSARSGRAREGYAENRAKL